MSGSKHLFLPFLLTALSLSAQTTPDMTGEYYLTGEMEVASGFRFNADSTFDFFFIYGAVDRFGKGTWTQEGDTIILESPRKPEKDFILKESKKTSDNQVVVQISDPNEAILRFVRCRIKTADGILEAGSNENGRIAFTGNGVVEAISLVHELWPDRFSVFEPGNHGDNYFAFTIDPHIADVEFRRLILHIEDAKTLTGGHPLWEGKVFRYLKGE
ncbi:MAG: hypothetical protein DYG98_12800 [Haliscomenobacteraceae bacterium CHB4]|nr:hypothetical protein [Saprospiraceae bacterium]MCE7923929.1 hypothetical protein [Haliscomenobacteraceae bacterium CHB4]